MFKYTDFKRKIHLHFQSSQHKHQSANNCVSKLNYKLSITELLTEKLDNMLK